MEKNKLYMFLKNNSIITTDYYNNKKLKELYNLYCVWCNKNCINTLSDKEFYNLIDETFIGNTLLCKNMSFDIVYSELCAYATGMMHNGYSVEDAINQAILYYENKYRIKKRILIDMGLILSNYLLVENEIREFFLRNNKEKE